MRIDRAGVPFIAGALVPAALCLAVRRPLLATPFVGLAAFMAYFFRDPDRIVPARGDAVVAPADGRVMVAGPGEPGIAPPGQWQQISIFLSPLDVHVNRIPWGGRLTRVEYRPGRFLPAYRAESGRENEQTELWIDGQGRTVVFRQVVGILARRIVCRVQEGDTVATGDRFGLMKFGSRMDVFVDPDAQLHARVGDTVRGGETILATFPPKAA
ncbi:MAG TPA: phosphatidylserine decarboxylase [Vicinamibacterales bacterium]